MATNTTEEVNITPILDNDGTGSTSPTSPQAITKTKTMTETERLSFVDQISESHRRKDIIFKVSEFIVFSLVLSYFIYVLINYFDESSNQIEYKTIEEVRTMPVPFIFIQSESEFGCDLDTSFIESDYVLGFPSITRMSLNDVINNNIDYLDFKNATGDSNWLLIYNEWSFGFGGFYPNYTQYLLIPPDSAEIYVSYSVDTLFTLEYECDLRLKEDATYPGMYYVMNHKDQLREYDLDQIIDNYYYSSIYVDTGYWIQFYYSWVSFENRIDSSKEELDYYLIDIGAVFGIEDDNMTETTMFTVSADITGEKTVYITTYLMDIYEVFSLAGGMYSTIAGIIMSIAVTLVWGFDLKIWGWGGVAPNSGYDEEDIAKLDIYMAQKGYASLLNKIEELEAKINRLEGK